MSETQEKVIKGGGFLVEDIAAEDMLTPEDFTSEHKMIAKTTEEYVKGEVWPVLDNLENHEFDKSVDLLKKAGELGLLGADVPEEYGGLGLDKVSSSLITEKMSLAVDSPSLTVHTLVSARYQSFSSATKNKKKNIYLSWQLVRS